MAGKELRTIEYKTELQDISKREQIERFGCLAEYAKVNVYKLDGDGLFSECGKLSEFQPETVNGVACCWGVNYWYTLKSQEEFIVRPSASGLPVSQYVYKPGFIKVGIDFLPYTSPPEEVQYTETPPAQSHTTSDTPPANTTSDPTQETQYITEIVPVTTEEWLESQVIRGGINEKCVNTYAKNTLGQGEVKADSDIISALIPDVETAQRIGFLATINSEKTQRCDLSIAPNFEIELGDQMSAETAIADIEQNQRIFEIDINSEPRKQDFTISWMGAEV